MELEMESLFILSYLEIEMELELELELESFFLSFLFGNEMEMEMLFKNGSTFFDVAWCLIQYRRALGKYSLFQQW